LAEVQEVSMNRYTDDQIANACMKYVDDWDMKTLLRFAYDEMYKFYTQDADEDTLNEFMQENEHE